MVGGHEVAPFGITTTTVNPGFFRTDFLTEQSTNNAKPSIENDDERRAKQLEFGVIDGFSDRKAQAHREGRNGSIVSDLVRARFPAMLSHRRDGCGWYS